MSAPELDLVDEEFAGPCCHQLYPALGLQPPEWCSDDALPGTDRCEQHLIDDENGQQQ